MKSILVSIAIVLFAAIGLAPAKTAAIEPDISHVMVIIAVSPTSTTHGIQMSVLHFPSERACKTAADVFGKPVEGVTVVARCAPAK